MREKILELAQQLIPLETVSGNPEALNKALELALAEVSDFTIERFQRNGVKSALVYTSDKRPEKFKLLLAVHLDIIPADKEQFTPRIQGDKLIGAGAMDMKANAACAILAFAHMARQVKYPVGLQIVTDEEIGGPNGAGYQVEQGLRADLVIATEPTNFEMVYQAKGVMQLIVTAVGQTAHGAYPWRGNNAIEMMADFLSKLPEIIPNPTQESWVSTVNVANISTANSAFNKIPDQCEAWLDVRYVDNENKVILEKIKAALPVGMSIKESESCPAVTSDKDYPMITKLAKVSESVTGKPVIFRGANGTSDVAHFAGVGCQGVEFGPIGDGIGSDFEWVSIKSLEQYYAMLIAYLQELNQD